MNKVLIGLTLVFVSFLMNTSVVSAEVDRSATITSPLDGDEVSGVVSFDATLIDEDEDDNVQWAIRPGTCASGAKSVWANVDGRNDPYDWDNVNFHTSADTSTWEPGKYCFVFNPSESSGDLPIRLTREFIVMDLDFDNDGVLNEDDLCEGTTADGDWDSEKGWGTNRWQVMDEPEFGWYQNKPAKKGKTVPVYGYDMEYTYGCNGHQILEMLSEELGDVMNGHWKFGLSSSVLQDFHTDMNDGVLDGKYLLGTYSVPVKNSTGINTDFDTVSGKNYYLEASGTYRFMGSGSYGIADAEWAYRNDAYADDPFLNDEYWTLGENTYSSPTNPPKGGLDILVDNTNIFWGDFNPEHVYTHTYAGTGMPINFSIWDSAYGDNVQIDLEVKVYADVM